MGYMYKHYGMEFMDIMGWQGERGRLGHEGGQLFSSLSLEKGECDAGGEKIPIFYALLRNVWIAGKIETVGPTL